VQSCCQQQRCFTPKITGLNVTLPNALSIADVCVLQGVWRSLLSCRRAELMSAVPLAGERLAQLQAATGACAACLQQLLPSLRSGAGMLAVFAAVNRATAEELGQTEALQLVRVRAW
jgi:hypothetical protein